jgi:glycosyltransferase involved in cell wall biosynthesis
VKLLLVTLYFPPAGGGGVQRPLKFASHLPALGIETHVLAPDVPGVAHRDSELALPTQAWVHRVRYVGPRGDRPAERLHGKQGLARVGTQASLLGRRLLVPDENVPWSTAALPAALRIVRREQIDVVLTTSPPGSLHLLGAAVQKATGVTWVADLRDSLTAHPHRRGDESRLARLKETAAGGVARIVAARADAIVAAAEAIAEETRALRPKGRVVTIANGCDFDDFAGLEHHPSERLRITHAGSFFGRRDPKPFLRALAESGLEDVVVRFVGDFRAQDREFAESLGLGDRIELPGYVTRRHSLELQRDSEALLLLIPEASGRGRGILSGKVFEYLAAERPILAAVPPDGAAAQLVRDTGAGIVAGPDDVAALREALLELHARWRAGGLDGAPLSPEWRERLSRGRRVEELADLLRSLA